MNDRDELAKAYGPKLLETIHPTPENLRKIADLAYDLADAMLAEKNRRRAIEEAELEADTEEAEF